MSAVAEQLRQARELQKMTVHDVADRTKIRTDHIRALEEGNYDVFSAPVYIKGFVRTYATIVRLDVPDIMRQLESELALSDKHHEHPPLTDRKKTALDWVMYFLSQMNWRIAIPVAVLLIVAACAAWAVRAWKEGEKDPLRKLGPGYAESASPPPFVLPVPVAPK